MGAGDHRQRGARRAARRPDAALNPLNAAKQVGYALETTGSALQQLEAVHGVRRVQNIEDLAGLLSEGGPLADRGQDLADADRREELLHEVTNRLDAYRRADGLALPASPGLRQRPIGYEASAGQPRTRQSPQPLLSRTAARTRRLERTFAALLKFGV